ncbi:MAG: cation diffusion facilitator family transporter, partial [Acidobacteriia bacterium]|nr:cation diffusion facilitator family transporter [Terriglobia bacterium]
MSMDDGTSELTTRLRQGRNLALVGVVASSALALGNLIIGHRAGSTSVIAAGLEFAGDVIASSVVFVGMLAASKPADEDHPYGHGRVDLLAGLLVGVTITCGGLWICYSSLQKVGQLHQPPAAYAAWPLIVAIAVKAILSVAKFRVGRRIESAALIGDAWNDAVDILSGFAALTALL